jgi:hypothetical protein
MENASGAGIEGEDFMKRVNAYVLAADPTWLEHSVRTYYPHVHRIVVSYDRAGRGWTGAPIPVEECINRLRAIDGEDKMQFVPGHFSAPVKDPMENDTLQRNTALDLAGQGADWVLQLDTDEWLPSWGPFYAALRRAEALGLSALEWPMRVLYRRLADGEFLEVCAAGGLDHFEYIAPVAVRSGSHLVHSRRTEGSFLRPVVRGDQQSIQLKRPIETREVREKLLDSSQAIVHNSWARSPAELRRKLASWSHSGLRAWFYYGGRWLPSVWVWRWMRNIHPFFGEVWPALRRYPHQLPSTQGSRREWEQNATDSPARADGNAIQ